MLITNQTNQDYYFGPLHLPAGIGTGTLTVDDSSATSLYLTDDGVADAINTLYAANSITVTSVTTGILFPRPTGTPEILHGDGAPEGLIYAGQGSLYMVRTAGSATNYLFTKTTGIHLNTGWVAINPGGIATYRKVTAKTVNTTTAATDLLNGEITIAPGAMGSTGLARLTAWGNYLQNSGGAAAPPRLQLVLGGTTLIDTSTTAAADAASASRGGWSLVATILNTSASAQVVNFAFEYIANGAGTFGGAFSTGDGFYQSVYSGATYAWQRRAFGSNTTSVATSAAVALVLNTINGSASATYEMKLLGALVEIV